MEIKTPEEIAKESPERIAIKTMGNVETIPCPKCSPVNDGCAWCDGFGKIYTATGVKIIKAITQAISAERNANAEKIKESDKCIDDLRFELGKQASWCIKLRDTMRETEKLFADELKSLESKLAEAENISELEKELKDEKEKVVGVCALNENLINDTIKAESESRLANHQIRSLESKLAEAEKEIKALKYENERFNKDKGVSGVSFEKYSRLEAEAKAVRSKTEELLKALDPIRQGGYGGASFIVQEAIRALNSKKE